MVNPFPKTVCLDIITDKHWFTENVLCLLSNAVKYSNSGTVTVTIEHLDHLCDVENSEADCDGILRLHDPRSPHPPHGSNAEDGRSSCSNRITDFKERTEDHIKVATSTIRISIEDTGIGISEEARKCLFQPFKQAQRFAGGTGLGLYSLSNRIEVHIGTVFMFKISLSPCINVISIYYVSPLRLLTINR